MGTRSSPGSSRESFLESFASSREIAPSATARMVKAGCRGRGARGSWRRPCRCRTGSRGSATTSAPPAMPALSVSQPTLCPMTSTMNTRPCEAAVVWMRSMASVATSTALRKPKVMSVPQRSLSIVLGRVTTLQPLLAQQVGRLVGAVAAHDDQAVELQFVIVLLHRRDLVQTVLVRLADGLVGRAAAAQERAPPSVSMPEKSA